MLGLGVAAVGGPRLSAWVLRGGPAGANTAACAARGEWQLSSSPTPWAPGHANAQFFTLSEPQPHNAASQLSVSQLILLNQQGTVLPSVARHWDARAAEVELRRGAAAGSAGSGPTAVQLMQAQRHGLSLPAGACRRTAAAALASALPPPVASLALLYGVLSYDGPPPPTAAAAAALVAGEAARRAHGHPLDVDLAPVARAQVVDLVERLGYIGRPPWSYGSAQVVAGAMRVLLADVDDEARGRPLIGMHPRQAELLRHLRARRAPPGSRGLPAVADLDPDAPGSRGVSRLAAARTILQLVQNHALAAYPGRDAAAALRRLGLAGPLPPSEGEAAMLAAELADRCAPPSPHHRAALAAAGYGGGAPAPDSAAVVKAVLRVMRRTDAEAASPATRGALGRLAELRRRPLAPAAAAGGHGGLGGGGAALGGGGGAGGHGGSGGVAPGPLASQAEVRSAVDSLPLSEALADRLVDLGWPGPLPASHGVGVALEEYLLADRTSSAASAGAAASSAAAASAYGNGGHSAHAPSAHASGASSSSSSLHSAYANGGGGGGVPMRRPSAPAHRYDPHAHPHPHGAPPGAVYPPPPRVGLPFSSRLGSRPEEVLTKLAIRGLFPGAVSEWHLPTMCGEEAEHVLACLVAGREGVLARCRGGQGYDAAVERWPEAEAEGEWWGMEWVWHAG